MNTEIFKDVESFDGLYQISNLGNVKSFQRERPFLMKPCKASGYLKVDLWKDGRKWA